MDSGTIAFCGVYFGVLIRVDFFGGARRLKGSWFVTLYARNAPTPLDEEGIKALAWLAIIVGHIFVPLVFRSR
jgi:hypothetical protein